MVRLSDMLQRVMEVSSKDTGSMADRVIKATEEVGEIAAGYGTFSGYKVPKKDMTKSKALENIKEECVDTMIVLFDILTRDFGMTAGEINDLFQQKCNAWEGVVQRKRNQGEPW